MSAPVIDRQPLTEWLTPGPVMTGPASAALA